MAGEGTVVLYPSPGMGHIVSMVEFGKLILTHYPSISITILIVSLPIEEGSFSSYISYVSSAFPSITFHYLPFVPLLKGDPSQYEDIPEVVFEVLWNNNPNVHHFLQPICASSHVSAFILDIFCYPSLEVSKNFDIPTYIFFTSGASALAFTLNLHVFDKIATDSFKNLGKTLFEIAGLFSVPASDMIEPMMDRGVNYCEFVKMSEIMIKSDGIIVNSCEVFEPKAFKALKEGICLPGYCVPPIYPIGPLIANKGGKTGDTHECLSWLDSQPKQSVVYLAFGSGGVFSETQLKEIAVGLEKSGVRFLWVVRSPPAKNKAQQFLPLPEPDLDLLLPLGFLNRTKNRGLGVKMWAPQIDVLGHGAIGGFVTHCGWNSTLEAICAGVPLVAWPLYSEQRFNRILLVEEMKIALPLSELEDMFVSSIEIEKRVRQIICSDESDLVRERILKLSHEAKVLHKEERLSKEALAKLVESWKQ